jgi:putative ABC transport system permease protein
MVAMTLPEAQRATGHDGYDSISISTGGEDPDTVKAAVAAELGRDFLVRTGEEAAEQQAQDLSDALGFIRIALLIFAGVALLVGGFLIFNTFTVTVAQRTKEFALLRVLGASRAQVLRSVLIETFAVGLLASILGVIAGLIVAPALAALMRAGGIDLGTTGTVVAPGTIIIGLVIGMVATLVSGFVPALRATRVEPITAMRDAVTPGLKHMGTIRVAGSGLLLVGGLAVLFFGLFGGIDSGNAAASLIGLGALLMMFAFAFLAPLLVRPLARVLGAPMARLQGLTGVLARENAIRQPQRTAVTAAALMIGLALVVLVAVFAAGLKATINGTVDDQVRAALVVQNQDGFSPIPADVVSTVKEVPGVTDVASMRFAVGQAKGDSGTTAVNGIDAASFNSVLALNWVDGNPDTLSGMTDGQVVVESDWASSHDTEVGGTIAFTTPVGKEVSYEVAGTFKNQAGLTADVLLTSAALERDWNAKDIAYAMAAADPDVSADDLAVAANQALQGFPQTEALTREEFKDNATGSIDGLLGLVYGLLMLSVLVALLGIVNTLALSVHERTRELGMLRAVGMTRNQVRSMVRAEAVITAGIGAILGIVLGVLFALIISRPLAEQGFVFTLPIFTLLIFFVLAAIAGIVAAIPPARRASKVDVLRAVTTE